MEIIFFFLAVSIVMNFVFGVNFFATDHRLRELLPSRKTQSSVPYLYQIHNLTDIKLRHVEGFNVWTFKCTCGHLGKAQPEYRSFAGTEAEAATEFKKHAALQAKLKAELTPYGGKDPLEVEWTSAFNSKEIPSKKRNNS